MADAGSRDRQPALCPFPGVDDSRPGWWGRCHTTLRCPGPLSLLPRSSAMPSLQAPGGWQAPLSLASTGAQRLGWSRELMFCQGTRAPGQTASEGESWGQKCPEEVRPPASGRARTGSRVGQI